jgi:hypothetical protein
MTKLLKLAFTGSTVLTPDYPDDLSPIPGPLVAVLPGARRVRPSTFRTNQINAQFAFVRFDIANLAVTEGDRTSRDADHRHPDLRDPVAGLCFLERESLFLDPEPLDTALSFDNSAITTYPTTSSTATKWIARWRDFAAGGNPFLLPEVFGDVDVTRVLISSGVVSSAFVHEPIARISFDYGVNPETRPYAQEIVVTLSYDDSVESVSLVAISLSDDGTPREPSRLTFKWYDKPEIKLLFGNGSLAAIQSVLQGLFAGQDHQGDFDFEFEVLYDVVFCEDDDLNRLPLPRITNNEIHRVPCIASMVSGPISRPASPATSIETERESGPMRRRRGRRSE